MTNTYQNLQELIATIKRLRGESGCPWDQKQDNRSLIKYLKDEVEEFIEGIQNDDHDNICEELGDLLYILLMYCEINEEQGHFSLAKVSEGINSKLIRRHPHVFEGTPYKDETELRHQWEKIKKEEKAQKSV